MNLFKFFGPWDYGVFIAILIITILSVLYGQGLRKKEQASMLELLLMGRSLTTPMFIATLVATWYGGIFATARIAFESGVYNFVTQGFFWYLSYILFAIFILKKIDTNSPVTLAELVGQIFGPKAQKVCALFNVINLVPVAYTISIGLLVQMFWDIPFVLAMLIGVSFVLTYGLFGGFRAVVFSDIIQFGVMMTAVILVAALSIGQFGLEPLLSLPDKYYSLSGGHGIMETLSWGLIALSTLVDPNFYQRAFAAKSKAVAKKGILISTGFWVVFDLCLTAGAMYARALSPEASSDNAYFLYALDLLPSGLKGFFMAGIFATVLSTLDSYLFLIGSTLTRDIFKSTKKRVFHFSVVISAVFSILLALAFEGNIKNVWKTLGSLSTSALFIPVMFGLYFKNKISDQQFVVVAFLGSLGVIVSKFYNPLYLDELYYGSAFSLVALCTFVARSKKRFA